MTHTPGPGSRLGVEEVGPHGDKWGLFLDDGSDAPHVAVVYSDQWATFLARAPELAAEVARLRVEATPQEV